MKLMETRLKKMEARLSTDPPGQEKPEVDSCLLEASSSQQETEGTFGFFKDSSDEPGQEGAAGDPRPRGEPLTLAARSQALFQEALLNGSIDQFLAQLQGWIERIRTFLSYADMGITTADNILNVTKSTLEAEMGIKTAGDTGAPAGMPLPASSLQLMWNLIQTPEFQTFTGRMLAQLLKMNLNPPISKGSPG
ncbi:hypothetical protein [Neomoorella thermoacetica]|uniref:hypothetical protein n=2 Tax=Neomoorella thermoacetica TaxID=1525 RepID=UPI001C43021C|nr:hypothetical protein [Moorella thermoacetica]